MLYILEKRNNAEYCVTYFATCHFLCLSTNNFSKINIYFTNYYCIYIKSINKLRYKDRINTNLKIKYR